MPSDLDIYRSAAVMVRHHGQDAMLEAVCTCDRLRQKGDYSGAAVWRQIMRSIDNLQNTARQVGDTAQ